MARKDPVSHLRHFRPLAPARLYAEIRELGAEVVPALEALLTEPEPVISALPVYAELAGADAVPLLARLLRDTSGDGFVMTVGAFARVKAPEAVSAALLPLSDPDPRRDRGIVEALAVGGAPSPERTARVAARAAAFPSEAERLVRHVRDPEMLTALQGAFDALPLRGELGDDEVSAAHELLAAMLALGSDEPLRYARIREALLDSIQILQDLGTE